MQASVWMLNVLAWAGAASPSTAASPIALAAVANMTGMRPSV
jgi:hypothetical protein